MISRINIRNFKLHENTDIELKGLTILTGMNGMGKSSIIQSLLLLRQSHLMNDLVNGINLKGDLCDIGTSGELSCQSSDEEHLTIGLDFHNSKSLNFKFNYPDSLYDTLMQGVPDNPTDKNSLSEYPLFNNNFQYLSAFRFGPQKTYNRDTSLVSHKKQISKIMGQCEYAVHFLEQFKNQLIPINELAIGEDADITPDLRLMIQVERWLKRISPNIKISIDPIGEDFKLNYKFTRDENLITEEISALNTGFGITYILPILVAILSAEKDSLIIIENPEAHIHPSGQAVLMELVALAVSHEVQIIMETHSDHIVNGSLVSITKEFFCAEMLSIYFFERDEHKHTAIAHNLEISQNGHIKRPPQKFFDQIDIDLRILTGV